ncbi:MAG: hypothetical protein HYS52_01485 [Candidatus Wildermuthbacteria bacterium]|nr:hypothetical protein [Candidatus Wildermuthbacteria bacterium]
MKNLKQHIILGIALGILLVAPAVLGFSPPTSTPPGGNVSPPVTTDTAQTITGLKTFNPAGLLPFTVDVSKTGIVANLNSDKLDSYNAADILALTVPAGAVMSFNLATCPSGWTAFTAGQGRYIVGLPSGGTLAGTSGNALGNLENRPSGAHQHRIQAVFQWDGYAGGPTSNISEDGRLLSAGEPYTGVNNTRTNTGYYNSGLGVYPDLVSGSNAPYIQLLLCQKS